MLLRFVLRQKGSISFDSFLFVGVTGVDDLDEEDVKENMFEWREFWEG